MTEAEPEREREKKKRGGGMGVTDRQPGSQRQGQRKGRELVFGTSALEFDFNQLSYSSKLFVFNAT